MSLTVSRSSATLLPCGSSSSIWLSARPISLRAKALAFGLFRLTPGRPSAFHHEGGKPLAVSLVERYPAASFWELGQCFSRPLIQGDWEAHRMAGVQGGNPQPQVVSRRRGRVDRPHVGVGLDAHVSQDRWVLPFVAVPGLDDPPPRRP